MADQYTDTGSRQNTALTQAGTLVKTGDKVTGNVQIATATHTVNSGGGGNDATNDIVYSVYLPAGVRILWDQSTLRHEAMGTAYTVKIGTTDDDDEGGTGLDLSSAGIQRLSKTTVDPSSVLTTGTWVVITLTSVTSATAAKQMTLELAYAASA